MTIDSDGEIVNAQDYYPFGAILRSYTTGSSVIDKYNPPRRTQKKNVT
jgi:hypothetical protein